MVRFIKFHFMQTKLLTLNFNPNFIDAMKGMLLSGIIGESLSSSEITGNNFYDLIIKIMVPIITGVAIPLVQNYIQNKKHRK